MLRERYAVENSFARIAVVGKVMEPVLSQLDDAALVERVRADLARRSPRAPETERGSTPVEVALRMLVVKHLYGWSDTQAEQWVNDRTGQWWKAISAIRPTARCCTMRCGC